MSGFEKHRMEKDQQLGNLLREAHPSGGLLSWQQVVAIVESAPAVRRSWHAFLTQSPASLRYSLAPLAVLFAATGALWVMPAQSEQVGTLVYTGLPSGWQQDTALAEVQRMVQQELTPFQEKLDMPPTLFVTEREGQDQLVFVLMGIDNDEAAPAMERLNARYPMLRPEQHVFADINTDPAGNRLVQLVDQVRQGAQATRSAQAVEQQVEAALRGQGMDNITVTSNRQPDGALVITVDTAGTATDGHTQEEPAAGNDGTAGTAQAADLLQLPSAAQK